MIEITERQLAEKHINVIKESLIHSQVDYCLNETPYRLNITLRKKLLKDFSCKVPSSTSIESSPVKLINTNSETSVLNESGIFNMFTVNSCTSCENSNKSLEEVRSEFIKYNLETKEIIEDLKREGANRESLIIKLEKELTSEKNNNCKLKKEVQIKNEQLKEKNKDLEKVKFKMEKVKFENEETSSNLKHKISNLEKVTKNLNEKLINKNKEITVEKKKLKSIHNKKNMKNKSIGTESTQPISQSTQTEQNHKSEFTKESDSAMIKINENSENSFQCSPEDAFEAYNCTDSILKYLLNSVTFIASAKDVKSRERCSSTSALSTSKPNIPPPKISKRPVDREASWSHVDPKSEAGKALELSRDLVGFLFAYSSPHRPHWTVEIMEDQVDRYLSPKTRAFKVARRKLRLKT